MSDTVKVDVSNPDLLKRPEFVPMTAGKHLLKITKQLKVTTAKGSDNKIIPVEFESQNEGEDFGKKVWDTLVLIPTCEWKTAQLAKACGVSIGANGEIDLNDFPGCTCEAMIKQETYKKADGSTAVKNTITQYLFETDE